MIGKFTKDTFITFITRVLGSTLGIVISIIIARTLGPKGKGIYSLSILFPSLLVTLTNFGITAATIFNIGKKKYSSIKIFGNNIIFTIFISTFAILVGLMIIFLGGSKLFAGVERGYLILSLFLIPFTLFFNFISHILLGLQKIKKYNIIEFLQTFSFFILIVILLIRSRLNIKAIIVAYILSFVLAGISLFFFTIKETKGITLKFDKEYFKNAFSFGVKIHLASIFSFLHYRIDMWLVNFFLNPIATGLYSVAVGLAEGILLFSQAVATVHFPKVASEENQKSLKEFTPRVCRNVLFITLLLITVLYISASRLIILFYSQKFLNSIYPFRVLLIGLLTITGWRILANDLTARGKPLLNTYITGISVALNIILNIILIPQLGIVGAAWASTVSYTFMFMITVFIYTKISGNKIKDVVFLQKSDLKFYKKLGWIIK